MELQASPTSNQGSITNRDDLEEANRAPFNKNIMLNRTLGDTLRIFPEGKPSKDPPKPGTDNEKPRPETVSVGVSININNNQSILFAQ